MTAPVMSQQSPTTNTCQLKQQLQQQQQQQQQQQSAPIKFSLITTPSALVAVLAANIQADVASNDALPPATMEDMTVFHALEAPGISVADYVSRVAKYAFCSNACLVAAYHYVTLAVQKEPKLALSSLSVHRLFITAVVLACKYFDDVSYNMLYYSKVGGLPCTELANLEINLLTILDFRLDISDKKFMQIENDLINRVADLSVNPSSRTQQTLLANAREQISRVVPVELPRPSDDVDFAVIVAEKERVRKENAARKPRLGFAGSVYTPEGSQMSRNSSMASVSSVASELSAFDTTETSPVKRPSVPYSQTGKKIVDSPTTPAATYEARKASAVSW